LLQGMEKTLDISCGVLIKFSYQTESQIVNFIKFCL
jgi:hypothetical protein